MNENKIIDILKDNGFWNDSSKIIKLSGDASSREYFRLTLNDNTFIVCTEEPNGQQSRDFNIITNLIDDSIKTPDILFYNSEYSLLVLEDVGDVSLKDSFIKSGLDFHIQAVKDISIYQDLPLSTCQNRFFDREKISFEFDLALNYFVKQYLKIELSDEDNKIITEVRETLIEYYEAHKEVVCHRDYHSNNLYVKNNVLYHIDYQDMRVGPKMYDLVSLVDDCYINFSKEEKESLLRSYSNNFEEDFMDDYKIVQVQRTFKALGSFAYLSIEKKKHGYLPYVESNLTKLIDVLSNHENLSFSSFSEILKRGLND